jgi:hypothetical protein
MRSTRIWVWPTTQPRPTFDTRQRDAIRFQSLNCWRLFRCVQDALPAVVDREGGGAASQRNAGAIDDGSPVPDSWFVNGSDRPYAVRRAHDQAGGEFDLRPKELGSAVLEPLTLHGSLTAGLSPEARTALVETPDDSRPSLRNINSDRRQEFARRLVASVHSCPTAEGALIPQSPTTMRRACDRRANRPRTHLDGVECHHAPLTH